jgi:hypothetical protein
MATSAMDVCALVRVVLKPSNEEQVRQVNKIINNNKKVSKI